MEKELTLTQIKAVFTKDFETFGKMDPYVNFSIGKSAAETETAEGAGKEPIWQATLTLHYYDETTVIVKAYERDMMSSEFMGEGKVDVKALKDSGALEIKIEGEGEEIGKVTCNYTLKTLPPTPLLTVKNIKCDFYKQTKFMLKTRPFFVVACGSQKMTTNPKEEGDSKVLSWDQTLRIKIKDGDQITFNVEDKEEEIKIFGYTAWVKQFKTLSGSKSFCVIDKSFEPLGTLNFDYETVHLVSKQESQRNQDIANKESNQLTMITIEKITGKLNRAGEDLYFKINLGPNMVKTTPIENAKQDFVLSLNKSFYAESKQNKMIFAAYDKDLISDDVLGRGQLKLQGLTAGEKIVQLKKKDEEDFGQIKLTIKTKKVPARSILIKDIKIKLASSGDILGGSQPYIIGRIGGWSTRTETGDNKQFAFTKSLEMKFSEQKQMTLQIWEEDINEHDKMFEELISIENFKAQGEVSLTLKSQEKKKQGEISFKYETSNVIKEKKNEQKKNLSSDRQKPSVKRSEEKKEKGEEKIIEQSEKKQLKNAENEIESKVEKSFDQNQKHSIDRSRNTFKLPSINDPLNYGDKIFDKQSSATLQKSIHVYSIPKAQRFGSGTKYSGQPSYYVETCFKPNSGRGVGFGFGTKRQFPDWMERNMKQNPAPGMYFDHHSTSTEFRPKGPTFGISYKFYEKVTIPKQKKVVSTSQRLKPLRELKK